MSVPAQIAVLLAVTAGLLDRVPLDQMTDAERAIRGAAADIPAEVRERLDTADKLSDEDREAIIEISRKALEEFSPEPDSKSGTKQAAENQAAPKSKPGTEAP